jgi:hypothetical protein
MGGAVYGAVIAAGTVGALLSAACTFLYGDLGVAILYASLALVLPWAGWRAGGRWAPRLVWTMT